MFLFSLLLACGDKSTDTAATTEIEPSSEDTIDTALDTDTENTNTDTEDTNTEDTNTDTDTDTDDTSTENNNDGSSPTVGAWIVNGPAFTTNTCGGGESFPETRSMTLTLENEALRLLIEAPGEYTYDFHCTLTDSEFICQDIVIENVGPLNNFTLYYTHQLQGTFLDNQSLEGDYEIHTTCTGGSNCTESNLGFTTPCEQAGTMTANAVN